MKERKIRFGSIWARFGSSPNTLWCFDLGLFSSKINVSFHILLQVTGKVPNQHLLRADKEVQIPFPSYKSRNIYVLPKR